MKNLLKNQNNLGFSGIVASLFATLFTTGIVWVFAWQITGIDLEAIPDYFTALFYWAIVVYISYFVKYLFFIKLVKWNIWLGKTELLLHLVLLIILPLTGDASA